MIATDKFASNHHAPSERVPATATALSAQPPAAGDTAKPDTPVHTDYNLQPLPVARLDHYLEQPDDGMFHIH